MKRALALIVALENYPAGAELARLEGTVSRAYEFVEWLLKVRGAAPRDVFLCVSPDPECPPGTPGGVRAYEATKAGIRSAAMTLAKEGMDSDADVFILVSGHGGRVGGSDVLMASDYQSGDGFNCLRLDELHTWLLPAMGPGTHYWFVEACRNEVKFAVADLALGKQTSAKGWATSNELFATAPGAAAPAQSKFPQTLLSSLHGKGRAIDWLEGYYWVTFPVVAKVVCDALEPEGVDVDVREDRVPGRILQLTEVPDVTVIVEILGARSGERYQLVLGSGARPPIIRWLTGPEQQINVPPGHYYGSLLRDASEETRRVSPPPDTEIPIYELTRLRFDRNRSTVGPDAGITVVGPTAPPASVRIIRATGDMWLGAGTEAGLSVRLQGPLNVELFDRDEPMGSKEHRGQGMLYTDDFFRGQYTFGELSNRAPAEAVVVDPDPALKLSLLAAAAIGDIAPYSPAVAALPKFDGLTATQASVYAVTPAGGGVMTVHSELQSAELTPIRGLAPAYCHAAVPADPAEPHRVHLKIPGADMVIPTVALAGRVTVIVLQPAPVAPGRRGEWRVHQFALQPGHLAANGPAAPLSAIRFSVLVQRRIAEGRPAMAAQPDPEHAKLWAQILEGRWPDPITMLLTAYELVRRGALAGNGRSAFLTLIRALEEYGGAFTADLAVLNALAAGREPQSGGEPLALDGLVALGGQDPIPGPEGMALDYRSVWTRWRSWPSRERTASAEASAKPELAQPTRDRTAEAKALNDLGLALQETQRAGEAITVHRDAAAIYRETGDRQGEAMALNNLGLALRKAGQAAEAITAHRDAARIYRETVNPPGEAKALNNLGLALQETPRAGEAITAHRHAATIHRQTDNRHGEAKALNNLGIALHKARRAREAITAYQDSQAIFRERGDRAEEAIVSGNLGLVPRERQSFTEVEAGASAKVELDAGWRTIWLDS